MIRKIKFSNFYSFKGTHEIDFTTQKKKNDNYFNTFDGKQISKVALIIGPNNSGKTNLMKLFGFLDYFVSNPVREDEEFGVGFKSYAFCDKKPSSFEVSFETENKLYTYTLKTTQEKVLEESLNARKLIKNSRTYQVFNRNKDEIIINHKAIPGVTKKSLASIKDNVSTIAFIKSAYDVEEIDEVANYFQGFRTNINEQGDVRSIFRAIDFASIAYNKYPELKEQMEELIKDFDLDIEKFVISPDGEGKRMNIEAVHKVDGKEFRLPLDYESRGTQALFGGLLDIIISIEDGTVLALDEIETGLHPHAVAKLVRYIIDEFAKKKRQFIFSSHSFEFMKKLDPQQIFFVEKESNESSFFRLDELGVRPDENFLAKYSSGAYGALPKIRI